VVCERWTLSTEVYQGLAGGVGAGDVRRLERVALRGFAPDLVLVLDVQVGAGLARIRRARDRMESKGEAFHEAVVRGYRRLAARRAGHVVVPCGAPDEVARRILEETRAILR
jgi:dTMP kinase